MKPSVPVERWQSRMTFVLALAMAAVGLGNVWRFGWLLGENGGAPFILTYVALLLLVGVPVLVAEIALGSHGRGSPFLTLGWATEVAKRSRFWMLAALFSCIAALFMLALSLLVAGWSLAYLFHSQLGEFAALNLNDTAEFLEKRLASPLELLEWQLLAALVVGCVSAAGIRRGVGLFAWIAVPLMIALIALLIDYALSYGDLDTAGAYLFAWQPLDYDRGSFMAALTHAGYTLIIGVAVGLSFGAHAPSQLPIVRSVLAVTLFDIAVGVAIALAVFPLLFASNQLPSEGFTLLFLSMPYAYGNLPFGDFFGALFFLLIFVLLVGSALALLEPLLGVLEQQFHVRRRIAAFALVFVAWLLSAAALLSLTGEGDGSFLQQMDAFGVQLLMPAAALMLALFVGWRFPRSVLRQELAREPDILFSLWYFLIRFIVPPVIVAAWMWAEVIP